MWAKHRETSHLDPTHRSGHYDNNYFFSVSFSSSAVHYHVARLVESTPVYYEAIITVQKTYSAFLSLLLSIQTLRVVCVCVGVCVYVCGVMRARTDGLGATVGAGPESRRSMDPSSPLLLLVEKE